MAKTISIDSLAAEITNAVKEYTEDVTAGIEKQADKSSRAMNREIRNDSPRKTGVYASGWTRKKFGAGGVISYVTYNKTKPWLTHLLEKGHVKRGGGRVAGKPHIRPAADRAVAEFDRRVREIIRNGG
ncbi:hypothetical protein [Paenibacillus senegalensis]|uniref:hypothetical protein n=1 Tax=Paenibacillus senegalensis TaxID=1465766 RepID=UPI000287FCF2|nr:hypothetical protein [Paenibacillus senegalensis]